MAALTNNWVKADTWNQWNRVFYNTVATNSTTGGIWIDNFQQNAQYLQNTWTTWNQTANSMRYIEGTGSYYIPVAWESWNDDYEETVEQRRQREERLREQKLVLARETALFGGALTDAQKALLTDNELRNWEDAVQRRREEELERQRARERQVAEEKERWALAEAKAEKLLLSLLDAEGKREWMEHRRVSVTAPSGREYRLFPTWAGGVALMGEGDARVATLCVHPRERVPECDAIVGNMLALQHSEEHVLKIAIIHDGKVPDDVRAIREGRQVVRERAPGGRGMIEVPVAQVA